MFSLPMRDWDSPASTVPSLPHWQHCVVVDCKLRGWCGQLHGASTARVVHTEIIHGKLTILQLAQGSVPESGIHRTEDRWVGTRSVKKRSLNTGSASVSLWPSCIIENIVTPPYNSLKHDLWQKRSPLQWIWLTDTLKIHCSNDMTILSSGEKPDLSKTSNILRIGPIATKIRPIPCGLSEFVVCVRNSNFDWAPFPKQRAVGPLSSSVRHQ